MRDYEIEYYDINGNKTYCWNNDIEYITDRIYENCRGVFEEISFWVKEHTRTDTLHIDIEGYKDVWHLEVEIDKKIDSLATEINGIVRYINKKIQ